MHELPEVDAGKIYSLNLPQLFCGHDAEPVLERGNEGHGCPHATADGKCYDGRVFPESLLQAVILRRAHKAPRVRLVTDLTNFANPGLDRDGSLVSCERLDYVHHCVYVGIKLFEGPI